MNIFFKIVMFGLVLLGLSACGPHYTLVDKYEPITDASQLQCVQTCDSSHATCSDDCKASYQACAEQAQQKAENALPHELELHERTYRSYTYNLRRFERDLDDYNDEKQHLRHRIIHAETRCLGNNDKNCAQTTRLERRLKNLIRPNHPFQPIKPTLNSLTTQYAIQCERNCGCKNRYKHCYISCGGQVTTEKVCVLNC